MLVEVFCVERQENEEGEEKAPEQREEMHTELVPHRALVPTDLSPEFSLALPEAVNIVACLARRVWISLLCIH